MKRKLLLACLFITGMVATQAQNNLIENGSFEDGETNWSLEDIAIRNYVGTVDGVKYLHSVASYSWGLYNARAKYTKEVATNVGGKTYKYSFWTPKTTNVSKFKGRIQVKDVDGSSIYTSVEGKSLGALVFAPTEKEKEAEDSYGTKVTWKEIAVEFKLPDNAHTIAELVLNISQSGIKADNIVFEEVKQVHPAPANLKVTDTYQREAKISWEAVQGATAYSVKVGDADAIVVTATSCVVTGLTPGETATVTVKSSEEDAEVAEVAVTAEAITTPEADRIPYVMLPEDGNIQQKFFAHIYDATNAPVIKSVKLDGTLVTADDNGVYKFNTGEGRMLEVVLTDGNQEWKLEYKGLNVQ